MDSMIYRCPISGYYYDPLAVHRKLLTSSKGQINSWIREHRSEDELESVTGEEKLVPVVREAFGLPDVNKISGQGVATETCIQILNAYLAWVTEKKERGQTLQPESPCADCPQV